MHCIGKSSAVPLIITFPPNKLVYKAVNKECIYRSLQKVKLELHVLLWHFYGQKLQQQESKRQFTKTADFLYFRVSDAFGRSIL